MDYLSTHYQKIIVSSGLVGIIFIFNRMVLFFKNNNLKNETKNYLEREEKENRNKLTNLLKNELKSLNQIDENESLKNTVSFLNIKDIKNNKNEIKIITDDSFGINESYLNFNLDKDKLLNLICNEETGIVKLLHQKFDFIAKFEGSQYNLGLETDSGIKLKGFGNSANLPFCLSKNIGNVSISISILNDHLFNAANYGLKGFIPTFEGVTNMGTAYHPYTYDQIFNYNKNSFNNTQKNYQSSIRKKQMLTEYVPSIVSKSVKNIKTVFEVLGESYKIDNWLPRCGLNKREDSKKILFIKENNLIPHTNGFLKAKNSLIEKLKELEYEIEEIDVSDIFNECFEISIATLIIDGDYEDLIKNNDSKNLNDLNKFNYFIKSLYDSKENNPRNSLLNLVKNGISLGVNYNLNYLNHLQEKLLLKFIDIIDNVKYVISPSNIISTELDSNKNLELLAQMYYFISFYNLKLPLATVNYKNLVDEEDFVFTNNNTTDNLEILFEKSKKPVNFLIGAKYWHDNDLLDILEKIEEFNN